MTLAPFSGSWISDLFDRDPLAMICSLYGCADISPSLPPSPSLLSLDERRGNQGGSGSDVPIVVSEDYEASAGAPKTPLPDFLLIWDRSLGCHWRSTKPSPPADNEPQQEVDYCDSRSPGASVFNWLSPRYELVHHTPHGHFATTGSRYLLMYRRIASNPKGV